MNRCPECNEPAEVWADRSGGVTVNFACDNPSCLSGKGPWDTPRPSDHGPGCDGPLNCVCHA